MQRAMAGAISAGGVALSMGVVAFVAAKALEPLVSSKPRLVHAQSGVVPPQSAAEISEVIGAGEQLDIIPGTTPHRQSRLMRTLSGSNAISCPEQQDTLQVHVESHGH